MKTFRLMLLGSVVAGVGAIAATDAYSADVEKSVKMYGHVNREIAIIDDGYNTDVSHIDNAISSSRFGVKVAAKSANLTIGGLFEWQFQANSSGSAASQTNTASTGSNTNTTVRWSDVSFATKYGTLFMGHGSAASDNIIKSNLSGANLVNENGESQARGTSFAPEGLLSTDEGLSSVTAGPTVDAVNTDFDGISRKNRIRYDTPRIMGFQARVSHVQGGILDGQINYQGTLGGVKIAAAAGAANENGATTSNKGRATASIAALHVDSGISAQFAYGKRYLKNGTTGAANVSTDGQRPETTIAGVGYQGKFFGNNDTTHLSFQWQRGEDQASYGDESDMWRIGVVHKLQDYGSEIYASFETIDLDRNATVQGATTQYEDINVGILGARVKF